MADASYTIRRAGLEDAGLLASLGARAFSETFAKDNTPEDLADYLRQSFSPEKQAEELAQPGSLIFILEIDGSPAGYTRLQDNSTDATLSESAEWNNLHQMELIRIYLLQAWTGQRLGDVLMHACIEQAQIHGVDVLWLGVWERNPRAIAFYKRWGFEIAGKHTFQLGQDSQTDFVMVRRVSKEGG